MQTRRPGESMPSWTRTLSVGLALSVVIGCSERTGQPAPTTPDAGFTDLGTLDLAIQDMSRADVVVVDLSRPDLGPPMPDVCDGVDNDFDPETPDGRAESQFHTRCEPDPTDPASACDGWRWTCEGGIWDCKPLFGPTEDPHPIFHSDSARPSYASIGWNGTNYVVAYQVNTTGQVNLIQVPPEGEVVAGPVELGQSNFEAPKIAMNGAEAFVIWTRYETGSVWRSSIMYARVNASMIVVDDGTVVGPFYGLFQPAIAHGEAGYVLSWAATTSMGGSDLHVYATHLNNSGMATVEPVRLGLVPSATRGISDVSQVAADAMGFSVSWANSDESNAYTQLFDNTFTAIGEPVAYSGAGAEGAVGAVNGLQSGTAYFRTSEIDLAVSDRDGDPVVAPMSVSHLPGAYLFDPQIVSSCESFAIAWQNVYFDSGHISGDGLYIVQMESDSMSIDWESNLFCIEAEPTDWTARPAMARGNTDHIGVVWNAASGLMFLNVLAPCQPLLF